MEITIKKITLPKKCKCKSKKVTPRERLRDGRIIKTTPIYITIKCKYHD